MNKPSNTLFFAGFGYVAMHFAKRAEFKGWTFLATARSQSKAEALKAQGVSPILLDGEGLAEIPSGAAWLISAPPDENGCPIFNAFKEAAHSAHWIGYLSTTGVYGDKQGGWVYEWTDVNPQSERASRRALAEQDWCGAGLPAHLFRLPGIYGPGRSALDRVKAGKARRIIKSGQVFSRIYVDDIASCLAKSLNRPNPGRVYHPCDDEPAPPQDVIAYAAMRLGLDVPPDIPIEDANLSPMGASFYAECKRVSNARTKSELGWTPRYKTYHSGLDQILATL